MEFREAWERVGALSGLSIAAEDGEFRYRFKKTYVVTEPGGLSIPRTNFEKVFRAMAAGAEAPMVQGRKAVLAILTDRRFAGE
jgi:hypothetical protein